MMPTSNKQTGKIITFIIICVIIAAIFVYYKQNKPAVQVAPQTLRPLFELSVNASQEEKVSYVEAVKERAVVISSVEIGTCLPDPKIFKVNVGESIDFMNSYTATRTIGFSPTHWFEIPPQGKRTILFNFFDFPGVIDYKCDAMPAGKVLQIKPDQI